MNPSYISEIGHVLQHARQSLHLTLPQASNALHIRAHYLQALETGELTVLPGTAYTKGYLLSYASFLHLDKDEILRRFERVEDAIPQRGLFFPKVFSKDKDPSNSAVWGGILFATLVYFIWFVGFRPVEPNMSMASPPSPAEMSLSEHVAGSQLDLACTHPKHTLYPACYSAGTGVAEDYSLLPLNHNMITVLELAN